MTWPIIEGSSLLHWHIHRGKKSLTLDLRTDEGPGRVQGPGRDADAVIEAMRPGALAKRGLGYEDLKRSTRKIVFCTISGYGMTGPYADLPSHGIAYDTWAGIVKPDLRRRRLPGSPSMRRSASTPARCSEPSACWPASSKARDRSGLRSWRSLSPTPRRPWTGTAARPGRPTSGPRTR
jgi:hypothetical protein